MTIRRLAVFDVAKPPMNGPFNSPPRITSLDDFPFRINTGQVGLSFLDSEINNNSWRVWEHENEFEMDRNRPFEQQNQVYGRFIEYDIRDDDMRRIAHHELGHFLIGSYCTATYKRRFTYVTCLPSFTENSWSLGHCEPCYSKRIDEWLDTEEQCRKEAAMCWGGQVIEKILGWPMTPNAKAYDGDMANIQLLANFAERKGLAQSMTHAKDYAQRFLSNWLNSNQVTFDRLTSQLVQLGSLSAEQAEEILSLYVDRPRQSM